MKRACIAIVDATRARIYIYDRTADPGGAHAVFVGALHEAIDLVNPGRRGHDRGSTVEPGAEPGTEPGVKPGAERDAPGAERDAPGGGATVDPRQAQAGEIDRRFARQVIDEIDRIARERALDRVLLVATPAMLGELRAGDRALQRPELMVEYVARDLARLTSPQIHDHLARLRLVAPRRASFAE